MGASEWDQGILTRLCTPGSLGTTLYLKSRVTSPGFRVQ